MTRLARVTFVVLLVSVCAAALTRPAWAQQPKAGQEEFVPIDALPPEEQLPAAPLLVGAYAFVWVTLIAYLWSIWRRLRKVESELRQLERRRAGGGAGS